MKIDEADTKLQQLDCEMSTTLNILTAARSKAIEAMQTIEELSITIASLKHEVATARADFHRYKAGYNVAMHALRAIGSSIEDQPSNERTPIVVNILSQVHNGLDEACTEIQTN